ncbi:chorismate synthase [Candidatus Peribacteria bacterium RIFCSPLOWO2_01_FULL_51_18]|nr:MAG: chorismate synthase [Candidatus Peribacteria bacterium RIFCSPHIGHO2_02_FULL_51_15]OGJ65293.1 MAG: chorismate synthase [Candidatus Peribacteria bacterium RIFCSPLOWO2_01_FULL_51_18]OGJ69172.1 MAG: chorismate synthase [Candidatus Peribacteria bacterium RIFCSPLOWO2_02_FULL_51_10]
MASNSFGNLFRITTFGESHGTALGVVIDGCPAGITLSEKDLIPELKRRSPGQSAVTTARKEEDLPRILSGTFEGKTTGMPIAIIVENKNQRPQDYSALKNAFRPGHADEVYDSKYGHRDFRGGGRSSGRETVARVIAGVVARKVLPDNVLITGHAKVIGSIEAKKFDPKIIEKNPVRSADAEAAKKMEALILDLKARGESVGGLIEIRVKHPPENLGDPVFGKIKARLADAFLSIGAVAGFSYGAGFSVAGMNGHDYVSATENFGGILGGITTGEDLILHAAVKPPSSVGKIALEGRHDPCIVPRVIPVLEAMTAIVLADCYLLQKANV